MRKLVWLILFCSPTVASAQIYTPEELKDTTGMLLADIDIQLQMTSAMNAMYNFDFSTAIQEFSYMRYRHRDHPLPYFLLALTVWWKMAPDLSKTLYDPIFDAYLDTTIYLCERQIKNGGNEIEASFIEAASWGFKSRLHSERELAQSHQLRP